MISRFGSIGALSLPLRSVEARRCWQIVVVAASAVLSLTFACIAPFPAMAVLASRTLSARAAVVTLLGAVLANQAVGFLLLGYPRTVETAIWGPLLAIATFAAFAAARRIAHPVAATLAAFVVNQGVLAACSLLLAHSVADFAPAIIATVALANGYGLVMLGLAYVIIAMLERVVAMRRLAARSGQATPAA